MDYHKSPNLLLFKEYGRNVQRMVEHLLEQPDRDVRTRMANETIRVMGMLAPYNRDMQDYRKKLWDHLHVMANYELDVDSPYPKPEPAQDEAAVRLPYHYAAGKMRQYGKNIELMVEKSFDLPEGPAKDAYIRMLATYMKVVLLSKHGGAATLADGAASDEVVYKHLYQLSQGRIQLSQESTPLMSAQAIVSRASISNASQSLYVRRKKKKPLGSMPKPTAQGQGYAAGEGDAARKRKKKRRR